MARCGGSLAAGRDYEVAIERLPDDYRTVVILHYMEQMRVDEIADALGVPAGTIKSRLSRARRELKRKLVPYFEPEVVR